MALPSASSERNELEQTSSAKASVLWASVERVGFFPRIAMAAHYMLGGRPEVPQDTSDAPAAEKPAEKAAPAKPVPPSSAARKAPPPSSAAPADKPN